MLRTTPALRACLIAVAAAIAVGGGAFDRPLRAQSTPRLEIALDGDREWARRRITAAADEAVARYREWLGPPPVELISISVRENFSQGAAAADPHTVLLDLPWWPAPRTMDVESQAAFGLARLWFPRLIDRDDTRSVADGIAWYLQSRIVERLFDFTYLMPGHSADTVRYFGGAVPWSFSILPRGRYTAGLGRDEFLAVHEGHQWPAPGRRVPLDFGAARGALAFGTLERHLTWPVLREALRMLAERSATADLTRREVERTFDDASGQDLAWFFSPAFDPTATFDYAVQSFSSELASCDGRLCFQTRVTVARLGNAVFSGTSRVALGGFEAGDAMQLRVTFADRQELSTAWSGRDQSRTFEYESQAPAVAARLDPEQVLVMDVNYSNQTRVTDAPAVPMGKWLASWVVWLQDAALSYGFLF